MVRNSTDTTFLIGISGKAGSGKDTVARLIEDRSGSCAIHPFAGPLKRAVATIFDMPDEWMYIEEQKAAKIPGFDFTLRYAQQTLGTEWGRQILTPDLWLKLTQIQYGKWHTSNWMEPTPDRFFIITDVRFENEAAWVRSEGVLIHVVRPNTPDVGKHPSEEGYNTHPHYVIVNDGSIEELGIKVSEVLGLMAKGISNRNTNTRTY